MSIPSTDDKEPLTRPIGLTTLSWQIWKDNYEKGFWSPLGSDQEIATKIALVHGEVSEMLEAVRVEGDLLPDKHLPHRENAEVECADAIIRLLDIAGRMRWDITQAIMEKLEVNRTRPYKHGKRF